MMVMKRSLSLFHFLFPPHEGLSSMLSFLLRDATLEKKLFENSGMIRLCIFLLVVPFFAFVIVK